MLRIYSRLGGLSALVSFSFVLIGLGLIAAILFMWTSHTSGILDAFRPKVDSRVVISGAIERLQAEGKLVVLSADVTAESVSSTGKKLLFGLVDAGDTSVRVRAPARVQYVISLDDVTRDDFAFDGERRRLYLALPKPRIDTSIVEVSTNPAEVDVHREIGWLRLARFSGRFNEDRARMLLRTSALHAGESGSWLEEAQASAREHVTRLLAPLLEALAEDVTLEIVFYDVARERHEPDLLPRPTSSRP